MAVEEAREEVEENLRGSFLEDVRARPDLGAREIVRRAGRLGCDLARGAVVLCAELTTDRPRHVVATISGDHPGALAQHMDDGAAGGPGRVYALLPAVGADDAPERTLERARALAERLGRHGTVGLSSFYTDPGELARAIQEAELVLDVLRRSDGGGEGLGDIGTGTYRLLFRVLASHPEEVRSFYEDTVAPIVRYDDQYRTDLVATLEAYFEHNCNMNATAAAIFAHRHTVAYRLERVKELTSLDPTQSEDRERLGLGLKAYRIIAPTCRADASAISRRWQPPAFVGLCLRTAPTRRAAPASTIFASGRGASIVVRAASRSPPGRRPTGRTPECAAAMVRPRDDYPRRSAVSGTWSADAWQPAGTKPRGPQRRRDRARPPQRVAFGVPSPVSVSTTSRAACA